MKKIKKIITALLNEDLNKKLFNNSSIQVTSNDFLYQEAVLKYLEKNNNIDFLILNENLPGENIKIFIEKINKISKLKIILIKNNRNKEYSFENIYKEYIDGEIELNELINCILNYEENYTEKLEKEIINLRLLLKEKNNKKINKLNIIKKIKNKIRKNNNKNNYLLINKPQILNKKNNNYLNKKIDNNYKKIIKLIEKNFEYYFFINSNKYK